MASQPSPYLYLEKDASIALNRRTLTKGPELEMVREFMDPMCLKRSLRLRSGSTAVFLEPAIDSGYPDLVVAVYDGSILNSWCDQRSGLSDGDLRVLSLAARYRSVTHDKIENVLGFPPLAVAESLETLAAAGMLIKNERSWSVSPRSSFFGLKRLIAVEAKMGNARSAMHQALYNKRFASEVYIMTPSSRMSIPIRKLGEEWGVGILIDSGAKAALPAARIKVPFNHVSLKFNEWIGRKLNGVGL